MCDAWAKKDPASGSYTAKTEVFPLRATPALEAASGTFLIFTDSDDRMEPDAVRRAVELSGNMTLLVLYNLTYVDEENRPLPQPDFSGFRDEVLCEDEVWARYFALAETRIYYVVAWNKLYRRSLFRTLRYAAPASGMRISFCCRICSDSAGPSSALPIRAIVMQRKGQHHGSGVEP